MNNIDNHNINKIIELHYNVNTKQIFDFLSDFMTNKFYNVVFELAKSYSVKNGLSISDNYKNIFDSYMDTLSINSETEEESKNHMFSVFLNHLYESYIKFINNQIISINDFIISVNIAFLPENYKNDAYIQNKQNLSILFHTLIYNLSKELYIYINNHINNIIMDRINENAILLRKECIKSLSIIRNELFIKFEQQDNDINSGAVENEIILNSELYKNLHEENLQNQKKIERMKDGVIKLLQREKNYKHDIEKLLKLVNLLVQKNKQNTNTDKNVLNYVNVSKHNEQNELHSNSSYNKDKHSEDGYNDKNLKNDDLNEGNLKDEESNSDISASKKNEEQINLNNLFNDVENNSVVSSNNKSIINNNDDLTTNINSELESLFSG
tara:strand:- start:910 stop:2058 length:1149 start_codon:yes stop_codon:yes gene_type:complete